MTSTFASFPPCEESPWLNPDSGKTYYCENGIWTPVANPGTSGDRYGFKAREFNYTINSYEYVPNYEWVEGLEDQHTPQELVEFYLNYVPKAEANGTMTIVKRLGSPTDEEPNGEMFVDGTVSVWMSRLDANGKDPFDVTPHFNAGITDKNGFPVRYLIDEASNRRHLFGQAFEFTSVGVNTFGESGPDGEIVWEETVAPKCMRANVATPDALNPKDLEPIWPVGTKVKLISLGANGSDYDFN